MCSGVVVIVVCFCGMCGVTCLVVLVLRCVVWWSGVCEGYSCVGVSGGVCVCVCEGEREREREGERERECVCVCVKGG